MDLDDTVSSRTPWDVDDFRAGHSLVGRSGQADLQ